MNLVNINILERMKHYNVPGVSVSLIDNGVVSHTENYGCLDAESNGYVDKHSIFSACSISKFLTGILVMKLSEQGIVSLDEDVNNKLLSWKVPENEFTANNKVTLRNLLSHQSGIVDPENSFTDLVSISESFSMVNLLEGKTSYCNTPIEVKFEPESEFHYSDAGYCVVQLLIEDVTKENFENVINEHIFQPLNMESSTFNLHTTETTKKAFSCGHNKHGEIVNGKHPVYPDLAASGLWTTSLDITKLVLELIGALKDESKIDISSRFANEMVSPQGCKQWTGLGVFLDSPKQGFEISSFGWGVGFQCMMVAYPYLEKGAVIMTNAELGVHQMEGLIGEIYDSLIF